jgi:hypothetical protein
VWGQGGKSRIRVLKDVFFFRTSPFQLPGARSGAPEMNDADLELPDEEHVGLSSGKSAERGLA